VGGPPSAVLRRWHRRHPNFGARHRRLNAQVLRRSLTWSDGEVAGGLVTISGQSGGLLPATSW